MTATISPPTLACRRNMLRLLARNWKDGSAACELALATTVHESLSEPLKPSCDCGQCLTCTWLAYRNGLALAGDILLRGVEAIRQPEMTR